MIIPRSAVQRTAVVTVGLAAVTGLALTGPAAADPPALNVDFCASLLTRVVDWPGGLPDGSQRFSDAYESYLLRQPACDSGN